WTGGAVQSALRGVADEARNWVRLPAAERISGVQADEIRDELREFAHLGGFTMRPGSTPWFGAALRTAEDARIASHLAARLSSYDLPRLMDRHARASAALRLQAPVSYADALARTRLYAGIQQTTSVLDCGVYAAHPQAIADAAGGTSRATLGERRRLKKEGQRLYIGHGKVSREELAGLLAAAARQLTEWEHARSAAMAASDTHSEDDGLLPSVPAGLVELSELHAQCARKLDGLRARVRLSADDLAGQLAALAADEDTAWKLPRLYELAARFDDLGLAPLLDELGRCEADPDLAAAAFDHAWYSSIMDQIKVRDPRYAAERGSSLDEIASDFRGRDVEYLRANRRRVRHAWAERLREAQDQHPLQARVIRKQAALRRGHLPLRRLLDQTSDVLFALKPCWAMSPLMVSQALPPTRLFDVVI